MMLPEGAKLRVHRHSEAVGDAKLRPEGDLSGETGPRAISQPRQAISPVCSLRPAVSLRAACSLGLGCEAQGYLPFCSAPLLHRAIWQGRLRRQHPAALQRRNLKRAFCYLAEAATLWRNWRGHDGLPAFGRWWRWRAWDWFAKLIPDVDE